MSTLTRTFYRRFWLPFYRIYALRYVQRARTWRSHGLTLDIPVGVFHPGIYFSTPLFLDYLQKLNFEGRRVLDVGTGSGAIALFAAQKGGVVTAIDLNPKAVATASDNAQHLELPLTVVQSDLFTALSPTLFDYILVNPPYYPRDAATVEEHAFFAGEGHLYFKRFFVEVQAYCHAETAILMILSEDCDWEAITGIATSAGFQNEVLFHRYHWGERLFVAGFYLRMK